MKRQTYKNQTFSIPIEISLELQTLVKRREMSRFVADALRKELDIKKKALRDAYLSANTDAAQLETLDDWKETLSDGKDEW